MAQTSSRQNRQRAEQHRTVETRNDKISRNITINTACQFLSNKSDIREEILISKIMSHRLLMKDPISFHAVTLLASASGARIGFLGSSVDEMKPCRRQVHECPFAPGMKPRSGRPNMNGTSSSVSAVGYLAAGRPPSRVPQADDHMCKSWRQKKTCPRKDKNLPCAFTHPDDHVPKPNVCFEFTRTGHCSRGTLCRFQHGAVSSTPASDPPAASAPAAPAAASLPGASAAAPATARPSAPKPVSVRPSTSVANASAAAPKATASIKNKKRSRLEESPPDADQSSVDIMDTGDDVDQSTSAAASVQQSTSTAPSTPAKKHKHASTKPNAAAAAASSVAGIPTSSTRWSAIMDEHDDTEEKSVSIPPPATTRRPLAAASSSTSTVPVSSLGSIASSTKPTVTRGRPTKTSSMGGTTPVRSSSTSSHRE
jgi:hypothetical protein